MRGSCLVTILSLGLAGCAAASDVDAPQALTSAAAPSSTAACVFDYPGYNFIKADPVVIRPGDTVTLNAGKETGMYGRKIWPDNCLSNWRVTPAEYATFDPGKRALTISKSTPAGTKVEISVQMKGIPFSSTLTITGTDEVVLTGTRAQSEEFNCPGAAKVGELEFTDNGRFGVTYQPFESYVDYWGTYRFDAATGALTMTRDGGNFGGNFDLEGTARFRPDGRLQLDGFNFGGALVAGHDYSKYAPPTPVPCTYIF